MLLSRVADGILGFWCPVLSKFSLQSKRCGNFSETFWGQLICILPALHYVQGNIIEHVLHILFSLWRRVLIFVADIEFIGEMQKASLALLSAGLSWSQTDAPSAVWLLEYCFWFTVL